MDISSSQYNSGSESGWTHYLGHSSLSENYFQRTAEFADCGGKQAAMEEEEEDLSMVSDASSGPPHYHDDCYDQRSPKNWYHSVSSSFQYNKESKSKNKLREYSRKNQASHLDDTASSPVLTYSEASHKKRATFSKNGTVDTAFDISHGFSASEMGKPKFRKHLSFFECSRKETAEQPGCFNEEERR